MSVSNGGTKAYYFGVWDHHLGHHLRDEHGQMQGLSDGTPFGQLDGRYPPDAALKSRGEQVEGAATLTHRDGWTLLAFWDRTGDSRRNSNSAFVFDAELDFDAALALARERFAHIWLRVERAGVEITL